MKTIGSGKYPQMFMPSRTSPPVFDFRTSGNGGDNLINRKKLTAQVI